MAASRVSLTSTAPLSVPGTPSKVKEASLGASQKEAADAYLRKHNIPAIMEQIMTGLIHSRPEDPKKFIVKKLEDARNAKARNQSMLVFSRENLVALHRIFDVTGKGHITLDQYKAAMQDLGATNYNASPNGHEKERIYLDDFVDNAFASLLRPPIPVSEPK